MSELTLTGYQNETMGLLLLAVERIAVAAERMAPEPGAASEFAVAVECERLRAERDDARLARDDRWAKHKEEQRLRWASEADLATARARVAELEEGAKREAKRTWAQLHPAAEHFVCPECGDHVKADEDGCCSYCGADCEHEACDCGPPVLPEPPWCTTKFREAVERWLALPTWARRHARSFVPSFDRDLSAAASILAALEPAEPEPAEGQ